MNSICITAFIILLSSASFYAWYYFKIKKPVDKEMKEGQKRLDAYDKYKNEIRNF